MDNENTNKGNKMKTSIKVLKQQISVSEKTIAELQEKFEEIDKQPDGPAQHKASCETSSAIGMEQLNLADLEKLLKKLEGGK